MSALERPDSASLRPKRCAWLQPRQRRIFLPRLPPRCPTPSLTSPSFQLLLPTERAHTTVRQHAALRDQGADVARTQIGVKIAEEEPQAHLVQPIDLHETQVFLVTKIPALIRAEALLRRALAVFKRVRVAWDVRV